MKAGLVTGTGLVMDTGLVAGTGSLMSRLVRAGEALSHAPKYLEVGWGVVGVLARDHGGNELVHEVKSI